MTGVRRFEDLECWKVARSLTQLIYRLTGQGAFARDYTLRDQIRRASVSGMSNIAEGFESRTDIQFVGYLGHARASAGETRAQLYVALDMDYIDREQFASALQLAETVSRQVRRLMEYLESHPKAVREEAAEYPAGL